MAVIFLNFAELAQNKLNNCIRFGSSNAICMCIHWSIFHQIGFFSPNPSLLGFEDGLFYNAIYKNKITTGHRARNFIGEDKDPRYYKQL